MSNIGLKGIGVKNAKKVLEKEGTNKTQPKPDPTNKTATLPGKNKYVGKTPFLR